MTAPQSASVISLSQSFERLRSSSHTENFHSAGPPHPPSTKTRQSPELLAHEMALNRRDAALQAGS